MGEGATLLFPEGREGLHPHRKVSGYAGAGSARVADLLVLHSRSQRAGRHARQLRRLPAAMGLPVWMGRSQATRPVESPVPLATMELEVTLFADLLVLHGRSQRAGQHARPQR